MSLYIYRIIFISHPPFKEFNSFTLQSSVLYLPFRLSVLRFWASDTIQGYKDKLNDGLRMRDTNTVENKSIIVTDRMTKTISENSATFRQVNTWLSFKGLNPGSGCWTERGHWLAEVHSILLFPHARHIPQQHPPTTSPLLSISRRQSREQCSCSALTFHS